MGFVKYSSGPFISGAEPNANTYGRAFPSECHFWGFCNDRPLESDLESFFQHVYYTWNIFSELRITVSFRILAHLFAHQGGYLAICRVGDILGPTFFSLQALDI